MKLSSAIAALFLAGTVYGLTPQHEGVINQGQESGLGKSFHRDAAEELKDSQEEGLMKGDVVMSNVLGGPKVKDEEETADGKGGIVVGQGEVKATNREERGLVTKSTKEYTQTFDDNEFAKILSDLKLHQISSDPHVTEKHQNEGRALEDAVKFEQIGNDIDGEAASDFSGHSVSMSSDGNRVAIGAFFNDGNGSNSGHVRIFEWNDSAGNFSWTQLGNDIDGEAAGDRSGISVSMSSDGNRVAVGARYNDGNGSDSGHVRIFDYNDTSYSWTQLGNDIDGEAAGDLFGYSVSMSSDGNRVAIGAYRNDGNGSDSGHVRIFDYNDTSYSWTQLGNDIDGEAAGDRSGISVSMSSDGNRVAVGAYLNDGNGSESGHVRIFDYNDTSYSWTQLGNDIDGEAAGDRSGHSVSMSSVGNRVAIGAHLNDGNGSDSGHVRIFDYKESSSSWTQLGSDIDGEAAEDNFGYSVSMSSDGNRVAIGAIFNDGNGPGSGHVRIFDYNDTSYSWTQLGSDIDGEAAGDRSGIRVSMSSDGNRVAIGAHLNDGSGSDSGHVRIFDLNPPTAQSTPGPTPSPTASPTSSPTLAPTPSPTVPPTTPPTPGPTPSPTASPTSSPTIPPTPSPTVSPFSWEIDPSGNWTATFDEDSAGNQLEGKYKMTVGRNYKFEVLKPDCKTQIGGDNAIYVASDNAIYVAPDSSKIVPDTGAVDASIGIAMDKLSDIGDPQVFSEGAETNTDKIKICIKGSLLVSDTDPTSVNFHETILTILINKARTFIIDIETERTAATNKTENVTVGYNVTSFICTDGDLKNASTWVKAVSNYRQGDPLKVCLEAPNTEGVHLDKVTKFELEQVTGGSKGSSLMIGVGDAVMAGGILANSECSENACMIQSMIPAKYFDDTGGSDGTPYDLKAEGEIVLKFGARRLEGVVVDSSFIGRSGATSRGLQSGESPPSSSFEVSVGLKGENMVEDDGLEVSAANPSFAGRLPVLLSFVGAVLFTGISLVN